MIGEIIAISPTTIPGGPLLLFSCISEKTLTRGSPLCGTLFHCNSEKPWQKRTPATRGSSAARAIRLGYIFLFALLASALTRLTALLLIALSLLSLLALLLTLVLLPRAILLLSTLFVLLSALLCSTLIPITIFH
jgi:hypothetical protein